MISSWRPPFESQVEMLALAIEGRESSYRGANTPDSVQGAVGPMQIMPATWKQYAHPDESIHNPVHNRRVGRRYISDLYNQYGDPGKVAAAYFSGKPDPNSIKTDAYGTKVKNYVRDVLARMRFISTAEAGEVTPPQGSAKPVQPHKPWTPPKGAAIASPPTWEPPAEAKQGVWAPPLPSWTPPAEATFPPVPMGGTNEPGVGTPTGEVEDKGFFEAIKDAAAAGFGDEPVGPGQKVVSAMQQFGPLVAVPGRAVLTGLDLMARGVEAGIRGTAETFAQVAEMAGEPTQAKQLRRDIPILAETALLLSGMTPEAMGSPRMPRVEKGIPQPRRAVVYDDVRQKLLQAGRSEAEADAGGVLWEAHTDAMARAVGKTPEEIYGRLGLEVVTKDPRPLPTELKQGAALRKPADVVPLRPAVKLQAITPDESVRIAEANSLRGRIADLEHRLVVEREYAARRAADPLPPSHEFPDSIPHILPEVRVENEILSLNKRLSEITSIADMKYFQTLDDLEPKLSKVVKDSLLASKMTERQIWVWQVGDDFKATFGNKPTGGSLVGRVINAEDAGGQVLLQRYRGSVKLGDGVTRIALHANADASTFLHESAHVFLEDLRALAPDSPLLKEDFRTLKKWFGEAPDSPIARKSHEQFARGFEAYVREGKAPNPALQRTFDQYREWLTKIYSSIKQLRVTLSDDVRGVMDRLIDVRRHGEGFDTPPPVMLGIANVGGFSGGSGPQVAGTPEMAGNINLKRILAGHDAKQVIIDTAETFKPLMDEARRGVITHEETIRLADTLGFSVEDLLKRTKGQAWNAEQMFAARTIMVASAEELAAATRNAALLQTEEASAEVARLLINHVAIQEQIMGATAEMGRALQAQRIFAKSHSIGETNRAIIDAAGGDKKLNQMIEHMLLMQSTPGQAGAAAAAKYATQAMKPSFWDKLYFVYLNNILSGFATHVANITGSGVSLSLDLAETAIAESIGVATRSKEGVRAGESAAKFFGMARGMRDGFYAAGQTMIKGVDAEYSGGVAEMLSEAPISWINNPIRSAGVAFDRGLAKGQAGRIAKSEGLKGQAYDDRVEQLINNPNESMKRAFAATRSGGEASVRPEPFEWARGAAGVVLPTRWLGIEDAFFRSIAYAGEIGAEAVRVAKSEGLKGDAYVARRTFLTANPTEEMILEATKRADYLTFVNSLGRWGNAASRFVRETKTGRYITPFIKTPVNMFKYSAERTPLGLATKEVRDNLKGKNGVAAQQVAIARLVTGSAMIAATAELYEAGLITGAGPSDPARRRVWRAQNRPYSFKVGDQWMPYLRIEPLATIMGTTASMMEAWKEKDISDEEMSEQAMGFMNGLIRNMTDKTFLVGPVRALNAIIDPDRHGEDWIAGMTGGMLVPRWVTTIAEAQDPYMRASNSIQEQLMRRVPGARENLPKSRDVLGRPIPTTSFGTNTAWLTGLQTTPARKIPLIDEMLRLKVYPSIPQRQILFQNNTIKLTNDEFVEVQRIRGETLNRLGSEVVSMPQWSSFSSEQQEFLLRKILQLANAEAKRQVISQILTDRGVEAIERKKK